MADQGQTIDYVVRVNDEQVAAAVQRFIAAVEQGQVQIDDLGAAADAAFADAAKAAENAESAAADYAKTTAKATEESKRQADQQGRTNKLLRDSIGQFRIFGATVNEWRDRITNARKVLSGYNADLVAKRKAQVEAAKATA